MKNTPLAKSLFRQCKSKITKILSLIDEYEEMRDILDSMGYRIPVEPDGDEEDTLVLPSLSLDGCIGGWVTIDNSDVLDEYLEHGPIPPKPLAPVKRQSVRNKRDKLGAKAGWTCRYCREVGTETAGPDGRVWHVDHSYPVSRGGDNGEDNLVLACATCNLHKHAQSALEYEAGRIQ